MELSPETAQVAVSAIGAAAMIAAAWIANGARRASSNASEDAKHARKAADKAASNAAPVSNGFAGMVRDNLAQILEVATEARDQATMANEKVDRHLEAHANAAPTLVQPVPLVRAREGRL